MRVPRFPFARVIGGAAIACAAVIVPAVALGAAPSPTPTPTTTTLEATPTAGPSAGPDTAFGGAPTPALTTASTPKCATSGLVVWLDTQGNGTAGSVYYTLEFTNLSSHACTLSGYPGVSAVNLAGHQLGSAASRDHTTAPHPVTLASGASATAVLRIVEAGNFPTSACSETTAAGLRVYPPNLARAKVVPFPFSVCSLTGPVYLSVRAVKLS
jgi:Protein of unknown function (DUF4232)